MNEEYKYILDTYGPHPQFAAYYKIKDESLFLANLFWTLYYNGHYNDFTDEQIYAMSAWSKILPDGVKPNGQYENETGNEWFERIYGNYGKKNTKNDDNLGAKK